MDDVGAVLDAVECEQPGGLRLLRGWEHERALPPRPIPNERGRLLSTASSPSGIWSPDYPWAPKPTIVLVRSTRARAQLVRANGSRHAGAFRGRCLQRSRMERRTSGDEQREPGRSGRGTHADETPRSTCATSYRRSRRRPSFSHRKDDLDASVEEGRWIAGRIPARSSSRLPETRTRLWARRHGQHHQTRSKEFLDRRPTAVPSRMRVLATVLFTEHRRLDGEGRRSSGTGAGEELQLGSTTS